MKRDVELRLCNYAWPGNVRQLQNIIRNVVVLHNSTHVVLDQLPPPLNQATQPKVKQATIQSHIVAKEINNVAPIAPMSVDPLHTETSEPDNSSMQTNSVTWDHSAIRPMADIEREVIQNAIDHCDGNVLNAAVLLELSPSTLYRKKQAWEADEETEQ